jgi:hydrogenase nickel incorporation protein HypA/HybF
MHELSMAQAIVDTVLDAAEKNNATELLKSLLKWECSPC